MQYSAEFVARLKAAFPGETYLHELAEHGSKDLPVMIKPRLEGLTFGEILEYLRNGKVDELRELCEAHLRRLALYYEACQVAFGGPSLTQ